MNNDYIPNTSAIPNILLDYWMEHLQPKEFKNIGLINEISFKSSCGNQIFRFEINMHLPTKGSENE